MFFMWGQTFQVQLIYKKIFGPELICDIEASRTQRETPSAQSCFIKSPQINVSPCVEIEPWLHWLFLTNFPFLFECTEDWYWSGHLESVDKACRMNYLGEKRHIPLLFFACICPINMPWGFAPMSLPCREAHTHGCVNTARGLGGCTYFIQRVLLNLLKLNAHHFLAFPGHVNRPVSPWELCNCVITLALREHIC